MATLTVRLLGRFAFVETTSPEGDGQVRAIMPDMGGNRPLALRRHKPQLALPRCRMISADALEFADGTFAAVDANGRVDEWATWDLTGFDVSFDLVTKNGDLVFETSEGVTLHALAPATEFDPRLTVRTPPETVSARVQINTGRIVASVVDPDDPEFFFVKYAKQGAPRGTEPLMRLADVATWTAPIEANKVEIVLRRFTDSQVRRIRLATAPAAETIECFITHTCIGGGADPADFEFAAYYDLLVEAPQIPHRPVPQPEGTAGDESCLCHFMCRSGNS